MKYKVVLAFNASSGPGAVDGAASINFYTKAQAIAACEAWRDSDSSVEAYLWNGVSWTKYKQVP